MALNCLSVLFNQEWVNVIQPIKKHSYTSNPNAATL